MIKFIQNPYYITNSNFINSNEIEAAIEISSRIIEKIKTNGPESLGNLGFIALIGVGNDANGKVYSLLNTKFCLKISPLGKHVGKNQELQFEINNQGINAIKNKKVKIEENFYTLNLIPAVAVAVDSKNAYTLMIRHDGTTRLWDEKISFKDKDNWDVINEIKNILKSFGGDDFLKSMDVNGNNLLVDIPNKKIYLIDPYVPE